MISYNKQLNYDIIFIENIEHLYQEYKNSNEINFDYEKYMEKKLECITLMQLYSNNKFNKRHLNKVKKDINNNVYITNDINDYNDFYNILKNTLKIKHNTNPTHTLEEFLLLKDILEDKQKLCIVKNNNIIIAGMYFIEVTPNKYYSFYITKNYASDKNFSSSCLLYIIDYFMETIKPDVLDFGITTENRGSELNMGLSLFKQDSMNAISDYRYLFLL